MRGGTSVTKPLPQPGDRLYQTQRVGTNRFTKVAVDILQRHEDGFFTVALKDGRARRWSPEAVAKLRAG